MRLNNKGFSAVESLIILVIVGVVGGIGWYVWSQNSNQPQQTNNQKQEDTLLSHTDTTGSFTFEYPESWEIVPYEEPGHDDPARPEPDWTKEAQPITLVRSGDKSVAISLTMSGYEFYGENGDDGKDFADLLAHVEEDYFATVLFNGQREDGRRALFSRVDYLGPPDAKVESFTDHRYYFDYDGKVLAVEFREKYHHDWPDDETGPDINNSQYLADFENIAKSIKFIK